ncbi:hypothetical protein D8674_013268 [Pyrus ussuriensis x Pyrus communis]|uniref:Uncharacterized protein n=1 Tax=Pyrus ussuriensis x Pyrus communis TaxID=2448454 RepID=A0A5N5GPC3_9ROSA|nr:hypothetical protein D8674_013268 [Pyrus ussuriensis x Pyrus communis]
MAKAYAELIFDIGGLVQRECSVEFESWKKLPEELKKSMLGVILVHWDVDKTNEKHWKYLDELSGSVSGSGSLMCCGIQSEVLLL